MVKFKDGQPVRITSKRPSGFGFASQMEQYLGKTTTILKKHNANGGKQWYFLTLNQPGSYYQEGSWSWREDWLTPIYSRDELNKQLLNGEITHQEYQESLKYLTS